MTDNEGDGVIWAIDTGRAFTHEKCLKEGANSLFYKTSTSLRKVEVGLMWEHAGQAGPSL